MFCHKNKCIIYVFIWWFFGSFFHLFCLCCLSIMTPAMCIVLDIAFVCLSDAVICYTLEMYLVI